MKILNLHGFMGEADNKNYKALCGIVSPDDIISPKLHYKEALPLELIEMLSSMLSTDDMILVGQSLGGWYADQLSRKYQMPCILTNPCYYPHKLELIRESGISEVSLEQYQELSANDQNKQAYVLCSNADTVLPNNYANCIAFAKSIKCVNGSHSTIIDLQEHLSDIIAMIVK